MAQVAHRTATPVAGRTDPVTPLVASLTQLLRDELNRLHGDYQTRHKNGMARLDADTNWQQLGPSSETACWPPRSSPSPTHPRCKWQTPTRCWPRWIGCRCRRSPTGWRSIQSLRRRGSRGSRTMRASHFSSSIYPARTKTAPGG